MSISPQSLGTPAGDDGDADAQPAPDKTFDVLDLKSTTKKALERLGWELPTRVQLSAFEPAVRGVDFVVQARTGTGKTGAFALPLVDRLVDSDDETLQALILSPTRELAQQSASVIEELSAGTGLKVLSVAGGSSIVAQEKALAHGIQIVSGTPGRVLDLIKRGILKTEHIDVAVLDEADEMLSMGFLKEVTSILDKLPAKRKTWLFSATTPDQILRMSERYLKEPEFLALSGDVVGALGIDHIAYSVSGFARAKDLVRVIDIEDPESAIIFCNTKAETEAVAKELKHTGLNVAWINGDLPQPERNRILRATRDENVRFLVATDVAARGIDISHLTHVINYELPQATEQYIHRTGRTGRAGKTGTAISIVSPQEIGRLYYLRLEYQIKLVERQLPTGHEEAARAELDRIALFEKAFATRPSTTSLATARRLLTHNRVEHLIAGLIDVFFGPNEDVAAKAQKARRGASARTGNGATSAKARTNSGSDRPRATVPIKKTKKRGIRNESAPGADAPQNADISPIFVNIGKSDGVSGDRLRSHILETHGDDIAIGDIRMQDRHSFVDVPTDLVKTLCQSLSSSKLADRELRAEPAKRRSRRPRS